MRSLSLACFFCLLLCGICSAEEQANTATAASNFPAIPAMSLAETKDQHSTPPVEVGPELPQVPMEKPPPQTPPQPQESPVQLEIKKDGQVVTPAFGFGGQSLLRHHDEESGHVVSGSDKLLPLSGPGPEYNNSASWRLICSLICWVLLVGVILVKGPKVAKGEVTIAGACEETLDRLLERLGVPAPVQWMEMEVLRSGELPLMGPIGMKVLLLLRVAWLEPSLALATKLEPFVRPKAERLLALIENKLPKGVNRLPREAIQLGERVLAFIRKNVPLPGTTMSSDSGAMEMSEGAKIPLVNEEDQEDECAVPVPMADPQAATLSSMLPSLPQAWAAIVPEPAKKTMTILSGSEPVEVPQEDLDPIERMARRLERAGQPEVAAQMRRGMLSGGRVPMKEEEKPKAVEEEQVPQEPIMEQEEEKDMVQEPAAIKIPELSPLEQEEPQPLYPMDDEDEEDSAEAQALPGFGEPQAITMFFEAPLISQSAFGEAAQSNPTDFISLEDEEDEEPAATILPTHEPTTMTLLPTHEPQMLIPETVFVSPTGNPFIEHTEEAIEESKTDAPSLANPFMDAELDDIDLSEAFQCKGSSMNLDQDI